ncbi:MAG: RsmE family RNA methyltransferase [Alphaproteobacteria bacterium]
MRHFFVNAPLRPNELLALPKDLAHRLARVLRLRAGTDIALLNGRDGLFHATFDGQNHAQVGQQARLFQATSSLTLYIALPKRDAMDSILRQATELGIAHIVPLLADHCVPDKLNMERAHTLLVEAAEQCERLDIPTLAPPVPLLPTLAALKTTIYWCAERIAQTQPWPTHTAPHTGLLVGCEGGFSAKEKASLLAMPHVAPVTLGSTILRTDTAVVAGIAKLLTL